ncbi:MAG: hypothetical protein AB1757_28075 [Acidobacteriota bacterium]
MSGNIHLIGIGLFFHLIFCPNHWLLREQFKGSLQIRLKRNFPSLSQTEVDMITTDIEASLTGYFREGGLTLATTLFSPSSKNKVAPIPSSIIKFINLAASKYDSYLLRFAFSCISLDAFVQANKSEKAYLGRISQGFFAYHSLGVFGDVVIQRLKEAKKTVWLVDSNAQIPALALGAATNLIFLDCFSRLKEAGVRFFTTSKLFNETCEHLIYADKIIKRYGQSSPYITAAAKGQTPFRSENQFLEGFIKWQAVGNNCDWKSYLFTIFGNRKPTEKDIRIKLEKIGIDVIDFNNWPGFSQEEYKEAERYTEKLIELREANTQTPTEEKDEIENNLYFPLFDPYKKARPESEAYIIVRSEREGKYNILSEQAEASPSWFISNTSLLNILDKTSDHLTWQPDAFLRFASTLSKSSDEMSADKAFQAILWGCAQSGLTLIDENILEIVMGTTIDQSAILITEESQRYNQTIGRKYGEPPEKVLSRLKPSDRPLAAIQLANEMAQIQEERTHQLQKITYISIKRAEMAEKKNQELEKFRIEMENKKTQRKRNSRKQQAIQSKKKRKKGRR